MDKYLKEIFAPPVNLKPAYTLNDMTFYSSDSLKEKYVLAFKKSSKGRDIANEIEKLVNKESIILFKLVMKQIFHQDIAKVPFYGKK